MSDNLESKLEMSRRDAIKLGLGALAGTVLSLYSNNVKSEPNNVVALHRKFHGVIDEYNSIMRSWNSNNINYEKARQKLFKITNKLSKKSKEFNKKLTIYDDPRKEFKFNPYLAVAVTYMFEGYDTVNMKNVIAEDPNVALPEIAKAKVLYRKGKGYLMKSEHSSRILVNHDLYNKDPKRWQLAISMAKDPTRTYWDYVRKLSTVAENIPKLKDESTRWWAREVFDKTFESMMDKNLHYPLKPLYKNT